MKIFVVIEAGQSMALNVYYKDIIAAFKTEATARKFIQEKELPIHPSEPNTSFYRIEEREVDNGSKTVSFLLSMNHLGYIQDPTVYPNKALVQKTRSEYRKLERDEDYQIDSLVKYHELTIQ